MNSQAAARSRSQAGAFRKAAPQTQGALNALDPSYTLPYGDAIAGGGYGGGPKVEIEDSQLPAAPPKGDKLGVLASASGPMDPGAMANYNNQMQDLSRQTQALGMYDKAGLDRIQGQTADAQRQLFGAGYLGPSTPSAPSAPGASAPQGSGMPGIPLGGGGGTRPPLPDPSTFMQGLQPLGGGGGGRGGALGGAIKGASLGMALPGVGNLLGGGVGALVGGISGLVNKRAASRPGDFSVPDASAAVTAAYTQYMGSPPSPAEVQNILASQGLKPGDTRVGQQGLEGVLRNLQSNGQVLQAQQSQAPQAPGMPPSGQMPPSPVAPAGVPGGTAGPAPAASPGSPVDYKQLGKYADQMGVFSGNDKLNVPWDQRSERYKMLTVQSNFDPNAGITPEMIAALNAADINGAKFSGDRDKLSATGLNNWENYDGREGVGDIIQGFNDPSRKGKLTWGAWAPEGGGAPAPQGAGHANAMASLLGGFGMPSYDGETGKGGSLGSNYSDLVMKYLAQQLGLGQALGGGR